MRPEGEGGTGGPDSVALLERRMALLEQQMESLDTSVKRLAEVAERAVSQYRPISEQREQTLTLALPC